MIKVKDICGAIENFAPLQLQEGYDNAGLQLGMPEMEVTSVLICLDVTEDVVNEAIEKKCNFILSHHPLLFKGLKQISDKTPTQRMVINALKNNIAIYSAHTNLDSTANGVSYEIANILGLKNIKVLAPMQNMSAIGLGVIGDCKPTPKLEFLRKVKEAFNVKALRFSSQSPGLVIRRAAVCGGSGASFIEDAINAEADIYITGDIKYHDFTTFGQDIILADIGHFESEICTEKIFYRILHEQFPELHIIVAESEKNPIQIL